MRYCRFCYNYFRRKKIKQNENKDSSMKEYVLGVISIILNIVLSSFNNITNKYMASRVSINAQMFYLGIFHCIYSLLWMTFTWDFDYTIEYFLKELCSLYYFFSC